MNYLDLLSVPFKYGGRKLEDGGLDCYGVVVEMHHRVGVTLPLRQFSENLVVNHALMASQMSVWKKLDHPQAGCVVLFRIRRHPCHIGYLLDEFEFLHAWEGGEGFVVVEQLEDWEHRIEGFYEYVG